MIRNCNVCKIKYKLKKTDFNRGVNLCCSRKCGNVKIGEKKIGSQNPNWKGNKVGYTSLHKWVSRWFKKPNQCELCKIQPPHDLANISQDYKRDLNDWEWLCRRCHMVKDGRLNNFIKINESKRLKNKNCILCYKNYKPNKITSIFCSRNCYFIKKTHKPVIRNFRIGDINPLKQRVYKRLEKMKLRDLADKILEIIDKLNS